MKIKFGDFITDARGSQGGSVYSSNASGAYKKSKSVPTNGRTSAQTAVRALFAGVAAFWAGLTDSLRQQWINAAADYTRTNVFGDQKKYTGQQLFMHLNSSLVNIGENILSAPQPLVEVPAPVIDLVNADQAEDEMIVKIAPATGNQVYSVEATFPVSPGVMSNNLSFKKIGQTTAAAISSGVDFKAEYAAVMGVALADLSVGQKIVFRVKATSPNTGQYTPYSIASALVTN